MVGGWGFFNNLHDEFGGSFIHGDFAGGLVFGLDGLLCGLGGGFFEGFFGLPFDDNAIEDFVGFFLQIIFKNKSIEAFDFGTLPEFFHRGGKAFGLNEVDGGTVFRELNFFSHSIWVS